MTLSKKGNISEELRETLRYMNDTVHYAIGTQTNPLIRKMHQAVETAKQSQEWRDAFMTHAMDQRTAELRGIAIGRAEGRMEGSSEATEAIAKSLLLMNYPIHDIITATRLSKDRIEFLHREKGPEN